MTDRRSFSAGCKAAGWLYAKLAAEVAKTIGMKLRSAMKVFRSTCCRLGNVLLVSALMSSLLVKSTAGEALVLHQHSVRRAHLHILGSGDLLSSAAWSSRFGHTSYLKPVSQLASQPVQVLAIVAIGSIFVSTAGTSSDDEARLGHLHGCQTVFVASLQETPVIDSPTVLSTAWVGRTTSAVILLRNHAILL